MNHAPRWPAFFLLLLKPDPGLQLLLPKTTWEWHVSSISFVFIFLIPFLDFVLVLVVYLETCFRNLPIFYKNKFDSLTEINIIKKKYSQHFLMRCLCSPRHNGIWTPAWSMHGHYEEEHGGVRGAAGQSVRLKGSFVSVSKEIINQSFLDKKHFIPGKDIQLLRGAWTEKGDCCEVILQILAATRHRTSSDLSGMPSQWHPTWFNCWT